nr:MAG TPA: hypothetical protein [Caudoviricetes sp.]
MQTQKVLLTQDLRSMNLLTLLYHEGARNEQGITIT